MFAIINTDFSGNVNSGKTILGYFQDGLVNLSYTPIEYGLPAIDCLSLTSLIVDFSSTI